MSTVSGTVTQTDNTGLNLLFTDTGSYTAPVTSRVLTTYDDNGTLINTYNMGANLTQAVAVTADAYITFKLAVTDATGVLAPVTINYLSAGIYIAAYLARLVAFGCECCGNFENIDIAEDFYKGAVRAAIGGLGTLAQQFIQAANLYVNI